MKLLLKVKNNISTYKNLQEQKTAILTETDLQLLFENGNISPEDLEAFAERTRAEMTRKKILSKYKIGYLEKEDRYWTRIDRKLVKRKSKKDLEDVIVKHVQSLITDPTLSSIYADYLKCRKLQVAETSWKKDIQNYEAFIKTSPIADIPLKELTVKDGYSFFEYCKLLKPEMREKYWKTITTSLFSMFRYAIEECYINVNPFSSMRLNQNNFAPKISKSSKDMIFSAEEKHLICDLAEQDAYDTNTSIPLGIVLLFSLGLRIGELCALKWKDLESAGSTIVIHVQRELVPQICSDGHTEGYHILEHCKTKSGDRRLPLNKEAVDTLSKIKCINQSNDFPIEPDNLIFLRKVKNEITLCNSRCFDARLRKYCRKANMNEIKSPHDIRRTVITNLYMSGMNIRKIQQFAGHTSFSMTEKYIYLVDDFSPDMEYIDLLSNPEKITTTKHSNSPDAA